MTLEPGTRPGAYEIVGPLGAGGMGEVYRARDTRLGRTSNFSPPRWPTTRSGDAASSAEIGDARWRLNELQAG